MDRTERFYKIERRIREQLTSRALRESIGISRATLNRDLEYLRDRLNVPIAFDREIGG